MTQWCSLPPGITTASGDTIEVLNDFTHADGFVDGLVEVRGNLIIGAGADGGKSAGKIIMDGTVDQTYAVASTSGVTCTLVINKTSGTVTPASGTTVLQTQGFEMLAGSFTAPGGVFQDIIPLDYYYNNFFGTLFKHSGGSFNHGNGTLSFTGCGWVVNPTVDILNTTQFYDVTLNIWMCSGYAQTLTTASGDTIDVEHNLILTDGWFYGYMEVKGNATVQSGFDGGTGTLLFTGSGSNQNFDLTGATGNFDGPIKVIKPSGNVILISDLLMDGAGQYLTLTKGNIISTSATLLKIGDDVTVSGTSDASYVDGPVQKIGNDAFTYPVGKNGHYEWCAITAPSTTGDAFTAEYFEADPSVVFGTNRVSTLPYLSKFCYWVVDHPAGASSIKLTLSWNSVNGGLLITAPSDLKVAHWDAGSGIWNDEGNGGTNSTGSNAGNIISANNISSFSPFTLASQRSTNPLPIELLSFTAQQNKNVVDLKWLTATEVNNDFFTIERSPDANKENADPIATIKGAGNNSSILNYMTTDKNPLMGLSYYRLKQTDYDGKYKYSEWKAIDFKNGFSFSLFPNPAYTADRIFLHVNGTGDTREVLVVVYDATGREVFSKVTILENNNGQVIAIDPSHTLSSGVYIISATSDNSIYKQKLIIR